MPVELLSRKSADALPVWFVPNNGKLDPDPGELARAWLGANGFSGKPGEFFLLPAADGRIAGAVVGTGAEEGRNKIARRGMVLREPAEAG
jgi:leucyl aminopeptidase